MSPVIRNPRPATFLDAIAAHLAASIAANVPRCRVHGVLILVDDPGCIACLEAKAPQKEIQP